MRKKQDNSLVLLGGILLGGVIGGYLVYRFFNETSEEQTNYIKKLEKTIDYRLSSLESHTYNLQNQYAQIMKELEFIKVQIQNDESKKLITELIHRVNQKYNQKVVDSTFYN